MNDADSARADYEVSPESGQGEQAVGFSAKTQQEAFLGGGGSEKPPKLEGENTTTRVSRSFLERTGQRIKKDWPVLLPLATIATLATGIDAPLVAKGVIAAVSLAPLAVRAIKNR